MNLFRTMGQRRHNPLVHLRGIREVWRKLSALPKWVKYCIFISLGAEGQTFSSVMVNWICPVWASKKVDPFLRPGFHREMYVSWMCYYTSEEIKNVLVAYVLCKMASHLSNYLFLFFVILFGYSIFGLLMYVWDAKRSELMWIDGFWTVCMLTWSVFKGHKTETIARIKSIF